MPELPDIVVYLEALEQRILHRKLHRVRLSSPFLLRTVSPPIQELEGKTVRSLRRIGKRIAIGFEQEYWLVLHLMIAGRLHWRGLGAVASGIRVRKLGSRRDLAAFDFDSGSLTLSEAGSKRRASIHVAAGAERLEDFDPGGLEVLEARLEEFAARLTSENHTLKRALTDPHLMSGIGNAYSDEILHAARLSPATVTSRLNGGEIARLYEATRATLRDWTERLRDEARDDFPERVTAFRAGMAVHGRYGQPCLHCGAKVQRIRYADNETNYCARCQTGGKLLADRSLSRLLKQDWPRTLEELEAMRRN
ncbi:MAG TPA: DNA-formamidopyrimidine glycosylase family protein [Terriglobia bacterium]|nr:DNA-formamidopyrimidine glycosylase family protein [Terriglobia bacterium]